MNFRVGCRGPTIETERMARNGVMDGNVVKMCMLIKGMTCATETREKAHFGHE